MVKRWVVVSLAIGFLAAVSARSAWSEESNPKFLTKVGTGEKCSPLDWQPPKDAGELGVLDLLKDIPENATWSSLPEKTKQRLKELSNSRLAAFNARWGHNAMLRKLKILLNCPTSQMTTAISEFYRVVYKSVIPPEFKIEDVKSAELARLMVKMYLGEYAVGRSWMTYPNGSLPNRDWDGQSLIDAVPLPDEKTYQDWKDYFTEVSTSIRSLDPQKLSGAESAVRDAILFSARAKAEGSLSADAYGGSDFETACHTVLGDASILLAYGADKGRPKIFANDDEVLREVNALYLPNIELKWLDRGTAWAATDNSLCNGFTNDDIETYVGPVSSNQVAKGIKLLKSWWIERLKEAPAASNKCTIYSPADRQSIWNAFSADQQFNNDGSSSMASYSASLPAYIEEKQVRYRSAAKLALQLTFPDNAVLTPSQRGAVIANIDAETEFGLMRDRVPAFLDLAQGTVGGPAAQAWRQNVESKVKPFGGGYGPDEPVRPADEAEIKSMFNEVKTWVGNRYRGYPIDVTAIFPSITFNVNTGGGATTSGADGEIRFGIGTKRSRMEYYSILLHELRHAVTYAYRHNATDVSKVAADEGPAVEGSGVAVEDLLLETFMRDTLKDDLAFALYNLDYGIRDARFAGTTVATLQRYLRAECSSAASPDTIEFAKGIANEYGLTGDLAKTAALRSHAGTQYLQYISSGLQIVQDIEFLQKQLAPEATKLDPYILFACNLNTPRRDQTYVSNLKKCLAAVN